MDHCSSFDTTYRTVLAFEMVKIQKKDYSMTNVTLYNRRNNLLTFSHRYQARPIGLYLTLLYIHALYERAMMVHARLRNDAGLPDPLLLANRIVTFSRERGRLIFFVYLHLERVHILYNVSYGKERSKITGANGK